jgi:hypothetical protein
VPETCRGIQPGASQGVVVIDSSPTPAAIRVDGEHVGQTPLRHLLSYTSQTRYLTVVAEPLYPSQMRQERRLRVPPLPSRIHFFMNNPSTGDQAPEAPR